MLYEGGERTASALYYFVTRRVPVAFTKLYKTEDIVPWIEKVGYTLLPGRATYL
jgi:protein disulfide-isomerase A6